MELIKALGLDWRILFAQLVNFAILIFVLWRFAYKPVFNILEERRIKIAEGLKNSEQAELEIAKALKSKKEVISEAKKEASLIIEESRKQAEKKYQEIISKSKEDLQIVINEEKAKIKSERELIASEIKKEISSLVVNAVERVLLEKVDQKKDGEMIAKVIKDLS
jgi:F-type H+-transporting ATPase subunit b